MAQRWMNDSKLHQAPMRAQRNKEKVKKYRKYKKKSSSGWIVMDSTCFRFFAHVPFYTNILMAGGGNAAVICVNGKISELKQGGIAYFEFMLDSWFQPKIKFSLKIAYSFR